VMLGLQNEREWATFCEVILHRPDLTADGRFSTVQSRARNREALTAIVEEVFAAHTAAEVIRCLDSARIANARMNDVHDVWAHPQLEARGRWTEVSTPAGTLPAMLPPGVPDPRMGAIPAVGEHTEAILRELGYAENETAALRAEGAI
jgi:itaconate CoA-transferase